MQFEFNVKERKTAMLGLQIMINASKKSFKQSAKNLGVQVPSKQKTGSYMVLKQRLYLSNTAGSHNSLNMTKTNFKRVLDALQVVSYFVSMDSSYALIFGVTYRQLELYIEHIRYAMHGKKSLHYFYMHIAPRLADQLPVSLM